MVFLAALAAAAPAQAFDGARDTTFDGPSLNGNGFFAIDFGLGTADGAVSVALQADKKTVVAGTVTGDFMVRRFNIDGTPDTAFGGGDGAVSIDIDGATSADSGADVAIQPDDGKIVVVGTADPDTGFPNVGIVRLETDGSLDATFDGPTGTNGNGKFMLDVTGQGGHDVGSAVAIVPIGRAADDIIIAGGASACACINPQMALLRLNGSNGALDTDFDTDGKVLIDFGDGEETVFDMDVSGTSVVLAGSTSTLGASAVARYNVNTGAPDTTFSADGEVITDVTGDTERDAFFEVEIQSDGKIVGGGGTGPTFGAGFVARYETDGDLDPTFDGPNPTPGNGFFPTATVQGLVIQADGKLVTLGGTNGVILSRFTPATGAYDTTFDGTTGTGDGFINEQLSLSGVRFFGPKDLAVGPDKKLTIAGGTTPGTQDEPDTSLARYLGDGVAPVTGISGPTLTKDTTPSFTFTSTETGSSFECRVDSVLEVDFESCAALFTIGSALPDGEHTITARATDSSGNVDATPATLTFTVDTQPPAVSILTGPSGATSDTAASFTFSSEAGATVTCEITGEVAGACSGPGSQDYPVLPEGGYTFKVVATDGAGNSTEATRAFTVDTTAPGVTIDSGPDGTTDDTTPSFTFSSAEGGVTFTCQLDAGAVIACSAPGSMDFTIALADGAHTFRVVAADAAGNASEATRAFTVQAPAPVAGDPAGTGAGSPPPPGAGGAAADTTKPVLAITFKKQKLGAVIKKGFKLTITNSESARATLQLVLGGKLAKRLRLSKGKPFVVGKLTVRQLRSGKTVLTIKLNRKAKRALARVRSIVLSLRAVATDAAGNRGAASKKVRLRR